MSPRFRRRTFTQRSWRARFAVRTTAIAGAAALFAVVRLGSVPELQANAPAAASAPATSAPAAASARAPANAPATTSAPAPARAASFAIATENDAATRAAAEILEQGGSAVDAAIAASAMLGVTEPVSCGLGGGGFALVYDASQKKTFVIDYREVAPARYDAAAHRSKQPGAAIGVPGEPAGLAWLHEHWGKKSFADDLRPAVRAATQGFVVSRHLGDALPAHHELFAGTPYGAILAPGGKVANAGDRVVNAPLAATLTRLGNEGPKAFYEGTIAAELVRVAQAAGSPLTAADLAAYKPVPREPLRATWEGYEVATMPPPSAGGLLLLETLGLFTKAELARWGQSSANYQHMLAEGMRGAFADRLRAVGDPAFVPDPTHELLAPERLKTRRARISLERTHGPARFELVEHGTSHLVVKDAQGNVVAMTTTVNSSFGSGVYAPGAGVLLNDELDDFTGSELAAKFGAAPNAPRGGAKPVSSMTPTIVFRDGEPVLALGGSGGLRIAGNVTQMLLCRLVFGQTPEQCLNVPRFFPPPSGPVLVYNEDRLPSAAVRDDLIERGEQIKVLPGNDNTGVQMIAAERGPSGTTWMAAGDPRKGGVGLVR